MSHRHCHAVAATRAAPDHRPWPQKSVRSPEIGRRAISSPNSPANQPAWHTDPWNPDQLRYFDGREWTTTVTPRPETPAEHDLGQPGSTEGQGFPLGQCILHVRALPQRADIDVACSIENAHRQQIAQIRPISNRHYVLLSQHEMALGFFTRGSIRKYAAILMSAMRPIAPSGGCAGRTTIGSESAHRRST